MASPEGDKVGSESATDDSQGDQYTTDNWSQPGSVVPSPDNGACRLPLLDAAGKLHILPHRLSESLHLPAQVEVVDPRFFNYSHRYLAQATLAMLAVLYFVDSVSDAALAAGLGSSVLILFIHPSGPAARLRSLVGGHALALVIGTAFALFLHGGPVATFLADFGVLRDLAIATSVRLLILIMAITNTEHPPAAGTVLGIAIKPWNLEPAIVIIAGVLLLAVIKYFLNHQLKDLI